MTVSELRMKLLSIDVREHNPEVVVMDQNGYRFEVLDALWIEGFPYVQLPTGTQKGVGEHISLELRERILDDSFFVREYMEFAPDDFEDRYDATLNGLRASTDDLLVREYLSVGGSSDAAVAELAKVPRYAKVVAAVEAYLQDLGTLDEHPLEDENNFEQLLVREEK